MQGHEINRRAAWLQFWTWLGAQVAADRHYARGPHAEIARELAAFEARRFARCCYALGTTTAALAAEKELR